MGVFIFEDIQTLTGTMSFISDRKYKQGSIPAGENVGDGGPLDWAVPAEGEARLAVDVLRVSCVRTIVTLVDGDLDLRSFRVGLPGTRRGGCEH